MTVKWSSQSFLGMNGWDLQLPHYSTPEVDSELLRLILLDLVQLGLWVKRFWLRLLLSKQPPTQLFHRTNICPWYLIAGTQTSRLRSSSPCWESHLLQELKSHWWLLCQLLWKFSSRTCLSFSRHRCSVLSVRRYPHLWDLHYKKDVYTLERVQRKAACLYLQNFNQKASVTDMLRELEWDSLEMRRNKNSYKMHKLSHSLSTF